MDVAARNQAAPVDSARAGPSFVVRPTTVADVGAVVELIEAVATEGRWIGAEAIDREERHAWLVRSIAADGEGAFTAESAGRIVGHVGVELRRYGVAELGMLVAAEWRGRGVGTALLRAALDWARQAGAHKVALQVWPHNAAALGLYRNFGFVEEGRLRRHYRRRNGELWDAVVMGLPLEGGAG